MNVIRAGVAALVLASVGPEVEAQTADLTQATCAELMDLPENDRGQLVVWLHGYYAGAAQRALLDRMRLENALAAIQQLCESNRSVRLIGSEARSLFLGDGVSPQAPPPPTPDPQIPQRQSPARPAPAR